MDAQPSPYPEYKVHWSGVTSEYRVTIWEQPELPDVDPEQIGWGEVTFDLVGVNDLAVLLVLGTTALALALNSSASARTTRLTVKVGTNHTYARTQLHPGETVICRYKGRTLSVTAPTGSEEGVGAGWPKPGTTDRSIFTLNVNVATNRAFDVTCVRGGYHSALVTIPQSFSAPLELNQRLRQASLRNTWRRRGRSHRQHRSVGYRWSGLGVTTSIA